MQARTPRVSGVNCQMYRTSGPVRDVRPDNRLVFHIGVSQPLSDGGYRKRHRRETRTALSR